MTAKDKQALNGLRLCDLYTASTGLRYRSIGEAADILAVQKGDGSMSLLAMVYPFRSMKRPFTVQGLDECKRFVRRWA